MIKVAIIGASGYTGYELVRLLSNHSRAEIIAISSRQFEGQTVSKVFGSFKDNRYSDLKFTNHSTTLKADAECFFLCLPHKTAMETANVLIKRGKKVIDLSADFRFKNIDTYEKWYVPHVAKELIPDAVYGMPELNRKLIKKAHLVANPGCYPTASILALAPLIKKRLIKPDTLIIDAKSGVTGAGRSASLLTTYPEVNENFYAYKIGSHRHEPEIEEILSGLQNKSAKKPVEVTFTPHLLPINRGILATCYGDLKKDHTRAELNDIYSEFYKKEKFVRVKPTGAAKIKDVTGSNYCDISIHINGEKKKVIITSVIDNLVKGASGQAVQNFNLMYSIKEDTGLKLEPLSF